jgi:dTDP-4-amino-4,6-dideoxygalactose transaminase
MPYREVESINIKDLFISSLRKNNNEALNSFSFNDLEFVGSGKSGISLILRYLRHKGVIPDRTYEMLVPQWLGPWVYSQIGNYVFPSKHLSDKTKILLMYHQYGFPQNINKIKSFALDNKLTIIEDCAHTLYGKAFGQELGFIGDYSLYSFSKYFFCYTLGAVRSSDKDFLDFVRHEKKGVKRRITFFNNLSKALYEYTVDRHNEWLKSMALDLTFMSYSLYDVGFKPLKKAEKIAKNKIDYEIYIRNKYYKYFRERTDKFGICEHLEDDNVFPYMIPIIVSDNLREKLIIQLQEKGFMTKTLHFDIKRFFIEPDFRKCIPIFCHSGISETKFDEQVEIVSQFLSNN